jgi:hypothetical protein
MYYQKTPPSSGIGASCRFPIAVVQHSTEFFSAADAPHSGQGLRRLDEFVVDPLMIAPVTTLLSG